MGMKLIYGLVLLLIIAIIAIVVFILSKWAKSKIGIYVSLFLFLIVILSLMTNYIDQWTIPKKDVISDLKIVNIELRNDFKITNNDISGMRRRGFPV
jgi:energy-coupling factor transporter transmembrane protein EcfT